MVEPQTRALDAADRLAIHFDLVIERCVHDRCIKDLAVQGDATFHDHALDIATRGNAGTGKELGNAFRLLRVVCSNCSGARGSIRLGLGG